MPTSSPPDVHALPEGGDTPAEARAADLPLVPDVGSTVPDVGSTGAAKVGGPQEQSPKLIALGSPSAPACTDGVCYR